MLILKFERRNRLRWYENSFFSSIRPEVGQRIILETSEGMFSGSISSYAEHYEDAVRVQGYITIAWDAPFNKDKDIEIKSHCEYKKSV